MFDPYRHGSVISGYRRRPLAPSGRATLVVGILLLSALFALAVSALTCRRQRPAADTGVAPQAEEPAAVHPLGNLVFPTDQVRLLDGDPSVVFQATASGRPESALYGSVRTASSVGRILPSFHEGLDIAPTARDRSGRAIDEVRAIAGGRLAYINPSAGDSNYGIYVVMLHEDPVGQVYSLYAHLASVAPGLKPGLPVDAGTVLGRMGNTPAGIIPVVRSHLHLEIGFMANDRFPRWISANRLKSPHGRYNGWNLMGIDPLAIFADHRKQGQRFTLLDHLSRIPTAFTLCVPSANLPDFFRRHPALWAGAEFRGPALVMELSEGGVPLRARSASADEASLIGRRKAVVLSADANVIGRNGRRLVTNRTGSWELAPSGEQWLEILMY